MTHINIRIGVMMLAVMLAACSNSDSTDDSTGTSPQNEIRLRADVWHVMQGTRATTYDNNAALQAESFKCFAYNGGTTTAFINGSDVSYADSKWAFTDGKKYWPATGSLDFFAYMPAEKPAYISAVSYTAARTPTITCTSLPMTAATQGADLKEFVWAITTGQNKTDQGESGVTIKFLHPFARIDFKLSASHPNIIINSITLKGIQNNGTCTLNGTTSTWTPSGDATDFEMTLTGDAATFNNNPNTPQPIGGYAESAHTSIPLLMVPQTWAGEIKVNATWDKWGLPSTQTVSTTIPTTWAAGYSYTYTLTINEADLIVNTAKYTEQW